jgi:hypothetical protein
MFKVLGGWRWEMEAKMLEVGDGGAKMLASNV